MSKELSIEVVPVSLAVFYRNPDEEHIEWWMQVRSEDGPLDGLLEFPGGKIEDGENTSKAVCRELVEEVGLQLEEEHVKLTLSHVHTYKDRKVLLHVHTVEGSAIELPEEGWHKVPWRDWKFVYGPKIPGANNDILEKTLEFLRGEVNL